MWDACFGNTFIVAALRPLQAVPGTHTRMGFDDRETDKRNVEVGEGAEVPSHKPVACLITFLPWLFPASPPGPPALLETWLLPEVIWKERCLPGLPGSWLRGWDWDAAFTRSQRMGRAGSFSLGASCNLVLRCGYVLPCYNQPEWVLLRDPHKHTDTKEGVT